MTQIKNLLPVGSVVMNKGANKRLMIIGILAEINGTRYDYVGVTHPEGFMDVEHIYAFQHKDIETVEFIGYMNSEYQIFRSEVAKTLEK